MNKILQLDEKLFLSIYTNTFKIKYIFQAITAISKPFFLVSYISLLAYIVFYENIKILLFSIVPPLLTIVICKILRCKIGRRRPYLIFPELNLQKKEAASFPSNHTASSFIISFMFFYFSFELFLFFFILASLVSISRIIIGIHFPADILSGFFIATIIYIIF